MKSVGPNVTKKKKKFYKVFVKVLILLINKYLIQQWERAPTACMLRSLSTADAYLISRIKRHRTDQHTIKSYKQTFGIVQALQCSAVSPLRLSKLTFTHYRQQSTYTSMFVSCYAPLIIQSGCGFGITVQVVFLLVCHKQTYCASTGPYCTFFCFKSLAQFGV